MPQRLPLSSPYKDRPIQSSFDFTHEVTVSWTAWVMPSSLHFREMKLDIFWLSSMVRASFRRYGNIIVERGRFHNNGIMVFGEENSTGGRKALKKRISHLVNAKMPLTKRQYDVENIRTQILRSDV